MALQRRSDSADGSKRLVSPIYARAGPSPSACLRVADGDERRAGRFERDWLAWRREYGELWDAHVVGTPEPPHHALFPGYARPA
jgi:hypothetical protein